MVTAADLEVLLAESGYPFERIGPNIWRVESPEDRVNNIVINFTFPIVVLRLNLTEVPAENREAFYARLLELNASSIPHGAFALEGGKVILIDTLQAKNLDPNELVASIESLAFTAAHHYRELKRFFA